MKRIVLIIKKEKERKEQFQKHSEQHNINK